MSRDWIMDELDQVVAHAQTHSRSQVPTVAPARLLPDGDVGVPTNGDTVPLLSVEGLLDDVHSGRRGRATTPICPDADKFWDTVARDWTTHLMRDRRTMAGPTGNGRRAR